MTAGPHGSEKILLAAYALQSLLPNPERPPPSHSSFNNRDHMLVPGAVSNKPRHKDVSTPVTIAISPILYGLVHFLAWSDQFPTPLERLLWRVSSFVVTCSGLVEVFAGLLLLWLDDRNNNIIVASIFIVLPFVAFFIVPLAHVLGSGFLIVESIRQLSFLDDAAYQLPYWSNYWPHLS